MRQLSCWHEVTEHEPLSLHDDSGSAGDWGREDRTIGDERVELAILAAGVDSGR